jgi:hypothetical protein
MTYEKTLESWSRFIPPRVPLRDVLTVAENVFEKVENPRRGSHLKVFDSRLKKFFNANPDYSRICLNGCFSIPHVSGREVKRVYVENMLKMIEIIKVGEEKGVWQK